MEQSRNYPCEGNRHIIQSYIFSRARSRFNIVQMRLLYRIVEFAQIELEGLLIKDNLCKIEHSLRHVDLTLPARSIMTPGSKHYEQVRKAVLGLSRETMELYDTDTKTWRITPLIYNVEIVQGTGMVAFSVADFVWSAMLDFTHGYRQYELSVVLAMRSPASMKFYTLVSGQGRPLQYTFAQLREMLGVADKYKQTTDFIKKVLKPAQAELNKTAPWTFTYAPYKVGRGYEGIYLYPVQQRDKADENLTRASLLAQVPASMLLGDVYRYLRYNLGFEQAEIASNKALFEDATKELPDMVGFLSRLAARMRNEDGSSKGKGWIVAAVKSELSLHRQKVM